MRNLLPFLLACSLSAVAACSNDPTDESPAEAGGSAQSGSSGTGGSSGTTGGTAGTTGGTTGGTAGTTGGSSGTTGGTAGTAGTTGGAAGTTGGTSGSDAGGSSGTAGTAGTGGASGEAGTAGTAGVAGAAGVAGEAGQAGSGAGQAGSGGTAGTAGSGGTAGTGGSAACIPLSITGTLAADDIGGGTIVGYTTDKVSPIPEGSTSSEFRLELFGTEFNSPPLVTGTFDLSTGKETNYGTCLHCALFVAIDAAKERRYFFQQSGTLELTKVSDPLTKEATGSLKNLTLIEITIDMQGSSTPLAGGACFTLASYSFEAK